MNWRRIRAVIRKDLKEVLGNRMVVLPMMVVPVLIGIVMPAVLTYLALHADAAYIQGADLIERIIPHYPVPETLTEMPARITYVFLNFSFIPLFMLIPIMVSSIIAANSVVGEKERKTLETLLYTPITNREFLVAKELAAFLPAIVIAFASFAGYFVVANAISLASVDILMVRSPVWIPSLLLLTPSVSLLGLGVALMVSLRAKSFMEAQQMSALIVIPFVVLMIVQLTGLVVFNMLYVLLFSAAMAGAAYLLVARIGPRFERERIISTL
jgi:ABC-type Na+ efflux pump permease subunit